MAALTRITNRRAGYGTLTAARGLIYESDTATCAHCNYVWVVRSSKGTDADPGGWCAMCSALICKNCAGKSCTPFERRLEAMEARGRMLAAMGL